MLGAGQWLSLIGFIGVGVLFVLELMKWRAPGSVIGKKQKIIRISLVVLMETLLAMIWFGPIITARKGIVVELIYWTICLTIGLAIFLLAMFDLRTVADELAHRNRRAVHDFLRETERDGK